MGKGDKVSWGGSANGSIGMCKQRLPKIQLPELGGRGSLAPEDNGIIVTNGDGVGGEVHIATGIA